MNTIPTASQLAQIEDRELDLRAMSWRVRAARGEDEAFGMAHVLEAERRRRIRARQACAASPLTEVPKVRGWWKVWATGARSASQPAP